MYHIYHSHTLKYQFVEIHPHVKRTFLIYMINIVLAVDLSTHGTMVSTVKIGLCFPEYSLWECPYGARVYCLDRHKLQPYCTGRVVPAKCLVAFYSPYLGLALGTCKWPFNLLAPVRCGSNLKTTILELIMQNTSLGNHCEIALR